VGPCIGVAVPSPLVRRIERATDAAELAATESGRKHRRALGRARRLFTGAARLARSDARGVRPKLAPDCAVAIEDAIHQTVSSLAP